MTRRVDPLANPREMLDRLYSYVAYTVGDGPDAEDVTSETFTRALRYRDSFDPAQGTPIAWLVGIARRVIAGQFGRVVDLPLDSVDDTIAAAAPDVAEGFDRKLVVRAAVTQLCGRDRELVALRYGADLTARQIGEVLGLSTNTVEVALHRVLAKLRAELESSLHQAP